MLKIPFFFKWKIKPTKSYNNQGSYSKTENEQRKRKYSIIETSLNRVSKIEAVLANFGNEFFKN